MVPAALKSMSSGWAATTRTRWISESLSMIPILRTPVPRLARGGGPGNRPLDAFRGLRDTGRPTGGRRRPPLPQSRSVQRRHDVLDPGVVLEPVHGQVLAVTRVLEATVRHLGDQRDVGVDPHAAEVQ